MPDSYYLTASPPTVVAPDGLSVSEIAFQLHRRIGWYGLDGLALRAVERQGDGHVVAEIGGAAAGAVWREVIDGWTGRVRSRAPIGPGAGVRPS